MKKESTPSGGKDNPRGKGESRAASGLGRRQFIRNTLVASTAVSLGQMGVVPVAASRRKVAEGWAGAEGRISRPSGRARPRIGTSLGSGGRATGRASNCTSTSWKTKTPDARLASAIPAPSCSATEATRLDQRSG